MAFSILSKWFSGGNAGGGKVAGLIEVNEKAWQEAWQRIERLERENAKLEKIAIDTSTTGERMRAELDAAKKGAKQLRKVIADMTAQHAATMQHQRHDFMLTIVELQTRVTGLTAQRDTATANFEWARLMFNKGEHERAILTSRIIERPVQAFTIDREPGTPPQTTAPADGSAGPTAPKSGLDRSLPVGEVTEQVIGGLANRFGVIFEDVGDDEAKRLGVDHTPDDTP